jgi:hypothetical protein
MQLIEGLESAVKVSKTTYECGGYVVDKYSSEVIEGNGILHITFSSGRQYAAADTS